MECFFYSDKLEIKGMLCISSKLNIPHRLLSQMA